MSACTFLTMHRQKLFLSASYRIQASSVVHILDSACLRSQPNDYQGEHLHHTAVVSSDIDNRFQPRFSSARLSVVFTDPELVGVNYLHTVA